MLKRPRKSKAGATLTVKEAASYLGVSARTVYNAVDAGVIPAHRLGTRIIISRDALEAWLRDR